MRVTSLGVHERSVDQVCTWASFKRRLLASMHGLTTAPNKHACAHHGAQQAAHVLTTAPHKLRIRSVSSDHGHWRHAGRHAPGGMATPSDHGGGVLDHGWFTVGSRRNVPTARRAGGRTANCRNPSSAAYQLEASAL
jgi:hypothetical protein